MDQFGQIIGNLEKNIKNKYDSQYNNQWNNFLGKKNRKDLSITIENYRVDEIV